MSALIPATISYISVFPQRMMDGVGSVLQLRIEVKPDHLEEGGQEEIVNFQQLFLNIDEVCAVLEKIGSNGVSNLNNLIGKRVGVRLYRNGHACYDSHYELSSLEAL